MKNSLDCIFQDPPESPACLLNGWRNVYMEIVRKKSCQQGKSSFKLVLHLADHCSISLTIPGFVVSGVDLQWVFLSRRSGEGSGKEAYGHDG